MQQKKGGIIVIYYSYMKFIGTPGLKICVISKLSWSTWSADRTQIYGGMIRSTLHMWFVNQTITFWKPKLQSHQRNRTHIWTKEIKTNRISSIRSLYFKNESITYTIKKCLKLVTNHRGEGLYYWRQKRRHTGGSWIENNYMSRTENNTKGRLRVIYYVISVEVLLNKG